MSKTFAPSARTPAVLTANNLLDGLSVWMSARGWTTDPRAATLYEDAATAETALLAAQAQPDVVVAPYLVESGRDENGRDRLEAAIARMTKRRDAVAKVVARAGIEIGAVVHVVLGVDIGTRLDQRRRCTDVVGVRGDEERVRPCSSRASMDAPPASNAVIAATSSLAAAACSVVVFILRPTPFQAATVSRVPVSIRSSAARS